MTTYTQKNNNGWWLLLLLVTLLLLLASMLQWGCTTIRVDAFEGADTVYQQTDDNLYTIE